MQWISRFPGSSFEETVFPPWGEGVRVFFIAGYSKFWSVLVHHSPVTQGAKAKTKYEVAVDLTVGD